MRPITDTLEIVGGKWKLPILFELLNQGKPQRFMELQRQIGGITAKMLSKELRDLEMNQLVERKVYPTTPVTVEYAMTEYGKTLEKLIGSLYDWGAQHRARILDGVDNGVE
jgi:DNA-binding HxlR family transcriptional regulator